MIDTVLQALRERGIELPPGAVRLDGFGDSEAFSIQLLEPIASGRSRAGAVGA